jgi:hypothetical protein
MKVAIPLAVVALILLTGFSSTSAADKEKSGKAWCSKFPDKTDLDELKGDFKDNFKKFKKSLDDAGATTTVNSVLRPKERAYLMHWSWLIVKKNQDAQKVDAMTGVDIEWWHGSKEKSTAAAQEMVDCFMIGGLGEAPALESNHTKGKAVDMSTSWSGDLKLKDADGKDVTISSTPRDSTNKDLITVAKTFKVIHRIDVDKDKNHWSEDGH